MFSAIIISVWGFLMAIVAGMLLWEEEICKGLILSVMAVFLIALSSGLLYGAGQKSISENKICYTCYSFYNKSEAYCPKDGSKLAFVNPSNEEEIKAD